MLNTHMDVEFGPPHSRWEAKHIQQACRHVWYILALFITSLLRSVNALFASLVAPSEDLLLFKTILLVPEEPPLQKP